MPGRSRSQKSFYAWEAYLVAGRRDEQHAAGGTGPGHGAHDLEPAGDTASALSGAVPPATAGRHHDDRGEAGISTGNRGRYVAGLGGLTRCRDDDPSAGAAAGLLSQVRARLAAHLEDGGPERLEEVDGVHQGDARPGGCHGDDGVVLARAARIEVAGRRLGTQLGYADDRAGAKGTQRA